MVTPTAGRDQPGYAYVLVAASLYAELVPGSVRDVAKCFVAGWSDHQYPTMTAAFPGWLADISPATGQQLPSNLAASPASRSATSGAGST